MISSFFFFLHLLGFAMIFTAIAGGLILERRMQVEKDWGQKLFIGKIGRQFGFIFLAGSVLILISGIINLLNLYGNKADIWAIAGWLMAKIILFAFMVVNGTVFGPILAHRRTKLLQSGLEKKEKPESELAVMNKSVSTYYLVQLILVIIIIYLSIAGGGRHI
jgi:hypothetical protein